MLRLKAPLYVIFRIKYFKKDKLGSLYYTWTVYMNTSGGIVKLSVGGCKGEGGGQSMPS